MTFTAKNGNFYLLCPFLIHNIARVLVKHVNKHVPLINVLEQC